MSFSFAGSMSGAAPVVRKMQIGETCYTGQLVMSSHATTNCKGNTWLLTIAASSFEDAFPILGIVTGVVQINDAGWNATYHGDTATCVTSKSAMVANDPIGATEIELTVISPSDTLIHGPLYNGTYGTAITELVETSGDSTAKTVTHANDTSIDYDDSYAVCYCRQGANRGHYRTCDEIATGNCQQEIPFPYTIVVGDIFVTGPGVPGITILQTDADCNFIDASDTLDSGANGFDIWLHTQNLEKKGEEFYVFAFLSTACGGVSHLS